MFDLFSQLPLDNLTIPYNRGRENNESLQENRVHFSGQARVVLDLLMKGETVSSLKMIQTPYFILDTRARIYSIEKVLNITIPETKIPGGRGAKEWSLTPELIQVIKNKCAI